MKRSVCLISTGMHPAQARLQPWKYLWETARGLARNGHAVTVITDSQSFMKNRSENRSEDFLQPNMHLLRCISLNNRRPGSGSLAELLERCNPQVILWHVGKTHFLRGSYPRPSGATSIGIFTGPLYQKTELFRIGLPRLFGNLSLSAVNLLATFIPTGVFRHAMRHSGLDGLVTETKTTAAGLVQDRLWSGPLETIFPAVDELWLQPQIVSFADTRKALGFSQNDKILLYLGSPQPLRGLPVLLRAFQKARQTDPRLKLLVLSREPGLVKDFLKAEEKPPESAVWFLRGFLEPMQVAQVMASSDIVVLPFVHVPSDAPLSLLEAAVLGKPLVTTRLASLPELAALGHGFLAEPGDEKSLSAMLLQAAEEQSSPSSSPFSRTWEQVGEDWSRFIENL